MENITQDLIKYLFEYKDGYLIWKVKIPYTKIQIGNKAGYVHSTKTVKRRIIGFGRKLYKASRLIFLYHHGYLPSQVDHIDRDALNDKIENLRAATHSENNKNRCSQKNSSSKYLGVFYNKKWRSWRATIMINGKNKYLGSFKIEGNAALAYNKAAIEHHKEFANINILVN